MSEVSISDIDKGFRHMDRQVKKDGHVDVGYWRGENKSKADALIDLVDIAIQNEFGSGNIPERSFLRSVIQENQTAITAFINKSIKKIVMNRMSYTRFVNSLGILVVSMVKKKITTSPSWAVPNSPATIKAKGN